jgi:hypothetical protein
MPRHRCLGLPHVPAGPNLFYLLHQEQDTLIPPPELTAGISKRFAIFLFRSKHQNICNLL